MEQHRAAIRNAGLGQVVACMWIGYVCGAAAAGNFYMSCPTSLPSAMTTAALEEALEECASCALPPRCHRVCGAESPS